MKTWCRSCHAEIEPPADWAGDPLECLKCQEQRAAAAAVPEESVTSDPGIISADSLELDSDLRVYRLGMRILGVVMLLLGAGTAFATCAFLVPAWQGHYLDRTWAALLALALFTALYVSLGVLALRLYCWTAWAGAVVFGLATGYALIKRTPGPGPEFKTAEIAVCIVMSALAVMALLVGLRGRKIRASGYAGDQGPRTLTRSGVIGAAAVASLLGIGLVATIIGAHGEEHRALANRPGQWQRVSIREGVFSVEMPGSPANDDQSFDTPLGKMVSHQLAMIKGSVEYRAACLEYPEGFLDAVGGPDKLFDGGRDTLVQQRKAAVLRDERGTLGGFPNRTLTVRFRMPEASCDAIVTQMMVLAEGRTYLTQSMVLGQTNPQIAADEAKFHASIELNVK